MGTGPGPGAAGPPIEALGEGRATLSIVLLRPTVAGDAPKPAPICEGAATSVRVRVRTRLASSLGFMGAGTVALRPRLAGSSRLMKIPPGETPFFRR